MPKVSVIIPVYKVEARIEACARSLFEQTLDDIEYIFINDCTPDRSMAVLEAVLQEYPARQPQVRIIDQPVNHGAAAARRVGVEAATGDYVIHCDSDDWVDLTIYEKLWRKAVSEDLDIVMCDFVRVYPDGHEKQYCYDVKEGQWLDELFCDNLGFFLTNKLVRRELTENIKWPVHDMGEDGCMTTQHFLRAKTFGQVKEILYFYWQNPEGIVCRNDLPRKLEDLQANGRLLESVLEEYGLLKKYRGHLVAAHYKAKYLAVHEPLKTYLGVFPEINVRIFFSKYLTLMQKLGHLTTILRIHGISKWFKK